MVTSSSLSLDDSIAFSNLVKYQQVVGSLQYVTLYWLDIAFAVNKVCQYTSLKDFLDVDWARDLDDQRYLYKAIINSSIPLSKIQAAGTTSRDLWLSFEKAYAPHSTSREYTLKTQLLRIEMHSDETPDAYLNRAQEYADALAAVGEPVKDKDLVMLVVLGLCEEYNGLKTTITARQSPTCSSELLHSLVIRLYAWKNSYTQCTICPQAL
ncbi:nucleotide-binding alpha-beta plait domain-containing protein [Tanacetum coccineum]